MLNTTDQPQVYTPEQVAKMLQLSKNTVYELINRGEIVAKRFGKVYRIPAVSLSFMFTGMDVDIYNTQKIDEKNINEVNDVLRDVRKKVWGESKSF